MLIDLLCIFPYLKPDINEIFVDACENGDINTVNNIIKNVKDFNIEITDNLGRTALRLAVENEQLEVYIYSYHIKLYLFYQNKFSTKLHPNQS